MDHVSPDRANCRDSLRISPQEQGDILSELEARGSSQKASERRVDQRLRYVQQAMLFMQVRHPGGTVSNYLVRTRNISKTGIGFLHGTFLYSGTRCTLSLRNSKNKFIDIEGMVVRCSHVRGHVHDVGVKFMTPIRLRDFMTKGTTEGSSGEDTLSSELPQLMGKVLHIEDSADDQELLRFHLDNLGVTVQEVSSGIDALEMVGSIQFDMIISGVQLAGMSGPEIAQSLRESGYRGPIIGLTADERDETRLEALDRGFTTLLTKPYKFEELLSLLVKHLRPAPQQDAAKDGAVISELWSNKSMQPLIRRFVSRLDGQIAQLQRLVGVAGTEPLLQKLCMDLKGNAGGYGFSMISKAAGSLVDLLLDNPQLTDVQREVDELVRMCTLAIKSVNGADTGADEGVQK